MILIAHRGNLNGPDHANENRPEYIQQTLRRNFDVEIDLWYVDGKLYLGHDEPQYECLSTFIQQPRLWIHCKNIEALEYCRDHTISNPFFWHDVDDTTLTSTGHFWTYPGKPLTKYSIAVMPEYKAFQNMDSCFAICSDYVGRGYEFLKTLQQSRHS